MDKAKHKEAGERASMSMRTKAMLWIVAIMVAVIAADYGLGLFFVQRGLMVTVEKDLNLARDIADDLVSTKINLLKSDAYTVAERLKQVDTKREMMQVMYEQFAQFPDFVAFTAFDRNGIIAEYGHPVTDPDLLGESKYINAAFAGESVISTTRVEAKSNDVTFHVCVPIDAGRILSATIPGSLFSDLLSGFTLWETGNIFILDEDGTLIADKNHDMVKNRVNYIELAKKDQDAEHLASVVEQALATESGDVQYTFNGVTRFCTYRKLTGSTSGWVIALAAPLPESPARGVQQNLLISALLLLVVAFAIALFSSRAVAAPYYKIQEQKQHLEELRAVAVNASAAKSDFLANMSHEMRTPLNAIIGLSELTLGAEHIDEENRQNVEKVYNAGMNLLGIVNDILDLSKIESGKFEIIEDEYDIPSLVNDTAIVNMVRIGSKPIEFRIHPSENLPGKLYGDELRLKQIFNNLLSNAFKYTHEGHVDWTLRAERDDGGLWLVSEIRDTGVGIRPEDVARLFKDYNQVDTKSNRKIEGTGLGLSITKRLAEMMGGGITVESEYGKGSVFTLRVRQGDIGCPPIGPQIAGNLQAFDFTASKRARNEKLLRIQLPYAHVLVVDDVATNLDVARGILKPYGIAVDCVNNGQAAVDAIRAGKEHYDAVFMDHMMPGMDGIEATRIIREEIGTEYAKTVPILALTANAIVGNEQMFLAHGFQAFLSKPIDIMAMDAAIRRWVRNKEKEEAWIAKTHQDPMERRVVVDRRHTPDRRSGVDRRKHAHIDADPHIGASERIAKLQGEEGADMVAAGASSHSAGRIGIGIAAGGGLGAASAGAAAAGFGGAAGAANGGAGAGDGAAGLSSGKIGLWGAGSQEELPLYERFYVEGLDIESGLDRFAGEEEIYVDVLRSYLANAPDLIGRLLAQWKGDLHEYAVTVHGIKSSSRSIGANDIGTRAEDLEKESKAGNAAFVEQENPVLVAQMEALLGGIEGLLSELGADAPLPRKDAPDKETLAQLMAACEAFDMDGADEAMGELEGYSYSMGGELVEWLRSQMAVMGFKQMAARLADELGAR